jgi:hypothetical protein
LKPRVFFYALVLAMVFLIGRAVGVPQAAPHRLSGHPRTLQAKLQLAKRQVTHDRRELASLRMRDWSLLSPLSRLAVWHRAWLARDARYVSQLERATSATVLGPSWLVNAFMCIHRGEGSWTSNTGNGYYGGLQMDYGFMGTYGRQLLYPNWPSRTPTVTADHWTPAEQISVAIRAYYSGRGFFPWPNTARRCGLI